MINNQLVIALLTAALFNVKAPAQLQTAQNPIIFADVPDISIVRVGT